MRLRVLLGLGAGLAPQRRRASVAGNGGGERGRVILCRSSADRRFSSPRLSSAGVRHAGATSSCAAALRAPRPRRCQRQPLHVSLAVSLGAPCSLGRRQLVVWVDLALKTRQESGLPSRAGRCGVLFRPAGVRGDLGTQLALRGCQCHRGRASFRRIPVDGARGEGFGGIALYRSRRAAEARRNLTVVVPHVSMPSCVCHPTRSPSCPGGNEPCRRTSEFLPLWRRWVARSPRSRTGWSAPTMARCPCVCSAGNVAGFSRSCGWPETAMFARWHRGGLMCSAAQRRRSPPGRVRANGSARRRWRSGGAIDATGAVVLSTW